ncbi:MAG: hypothetical protein ACREHG_04530 [Candidatus Saccharimonadales bacterium]
MMNYERILLLLSVIDSAASVGLSHSSWVQLAYDELRAMPKDEDVTFKDLVNIVEKGMGAQS